MAQGEVVQRYTQGGVREQAAEYPRQRPFFQYAEPCQALRRATPARRGKGIEDDASAESLRLRGVAYDEAVAVQYSRGLIDHQLGQYALTGMSHVTLHQRQTTAETATTDMQVNGSPVGHVLGQHQPDIEALGWSVQARMHQPLPSGDGRARQAFAGNVESAAFTGVCR